MADNNDAETVRKLQERRAFMNQFTIEGRLQRIKAYKDAKKQARRNGDAKLMKDYESAIQELKLLGNPKRTFIRPVPEGPLVPAGPGRPPRGSNNASALRAAIDERNITREKLAKDAKLNLTTVYRALAGAKMDPATWKALWDALRP